MQIFFFSMCISVCFLNVVFLYHLTSLAFKIVTSFCCFSRKEKMKADYEYVYQQQNTLLSVNTLFPVWSPDFMMALINSKILCDSERNYLAGKISVNTENLLKFDSVIRNCCNWVKYLLLPSCPGSCKTSLVGLSCDIPDHRVFYWLKAHILLCFFQDKYCTQLEYALCWVQYLAKLKLKEESSATFLTALLLPCLDLWKYLFGL